MDGANRFDTKPGGNFGDLSIRASTSDVEACTAYASVDSAAPDRLVVVVTNKREAPISVGIRIAHPSVFETAGCYQLSAASEEIQSCGQLQSVASNAFDYDMPALSILVLVPRP